MYDGPCLESRVHISSTYRNGRSNTENKFYDKIFVKLSFMIDCEIKFSLPVDRILYHQRSIHDQIDRPCPRHMDRFGSSL